MNGARVIAAVFLVGAPVGCAGVQGSSGVGRIDARPGGGGGACEPGLHRLQVGSPKKTWMRVTAGSVRGRKALVVVLHGAGGASRDGLRAFRGGFGAPGLVMVAPAARGRTWSALLGSDVDLETVDRALAEAFRRCRIDPARVGVGGFSDGATYALSLGLANGRLFRAVMALSPGGIVGDERRGKPRILVVHGTLDRVLPYSGSRDVLVPRLRDAGYRVTFRSFRGGHEARETESRAAVRWFLRGR